MCIALPARVTAIEPGHAWVDTREGRRRVSTALVGTPAAGDWLLVFLDSARSVIDAERAAEIEATLDLVQAAMDPHGLPHGLHGLHGSDASFELPSSLDAATLARLTGQSPAAGAAVPLTPAPTGITGPFGAST